MAESTRLRLRPWATGSAVLGLVTLAIYLTLIVFEGNNTFFAILPWALLMAIAPALAVSSVHVADHRIASNLLFGAAALYAVLGFVGLLSIGFGFLLAAAAAVIGASRS